MGASLKLTTMYKITDRQEPTDLTPEDRERVEIECANYLIKSGVPKLMREGERRLVRIHMRKLKAEELTELGAWLLAKRRTWWIKKVEEKAMSNG